MPSTNKLTPEKLIRFTSRASAKGKLKSQLTPAALGQGTSPDYGNSNKNEL